MAMEAKKVAHSFQVGDRVRILYTDNWRGRIVEFRGPLGPGGKLVYRVRIPHKPRATYIELLEDQMVHIPTAAQAEPSALPSTPKTEPRSPKLKHKKGRVGQ